MLFGTVGVAPGSFTFTIPQGGSAQLLGADSCVVDNGNGPVSYGVPAYGWYDAASRWYTSQIMHGGGMSPGSSGSVPTCSHNVDLDPYGTDSKLQGLAEAATVLGIRLDVLGVMSAILIGTGFAVHHFSKPRRRRR